MISAITDLNNNSIHVHPQTVSFLSQFLWHEKKAAKQRNKWQNLCSSRRYPYSTQRVIVNSKRKGGGGGLRGSGNPFTATSTFTDLVVKNTDDH